MSEKCDCEYCKNDDHINCSNPNLMCGCYCDQLEDAHKDKTISSLESKNKELGELVGEFIRYIKEYNPECSKGCSCGIEKLLEKAKEKGITTQD